MNLFFKQHFQQSLVALALLLFAVVAGYFIWGIMTISTNVNQAVSAKATDGASVSFDLQGAANLNLKGLVGSSQ